MKFLIMESSAIFCHFISLRTKYSPQHRSQTPSVYVPPLMSKTKFRTHTEPRVKLYVSYILIFMFLTADEKKKGFALAVGY
jgi:hypothetical protein